MPLLQSNLVAETDEFGNRTQNTYDGFGRKILTKQPKVITEDGSQKHPTVQVEYDLLDNPLKTTDAEGRITQASYTVKNNPYHIIYQDRTDERYEYNLNGTLCKKSHETVLSLFLSMTH